MERARVVDNGARVTRARTIAAASVGLTLLLFAPMFGWWTLALFALSALNTQTVDRRIARSARPELHVAASVVWSQLLLAVAVAHPAPLVVSIALLVSITAVVGALSGAELEQRSESVLDPLTGLLNRTALGRRFQELEEQARLTGETVSLLLCDIDRFKLVNDTYGHDRGDAVLRAFAYELRKQLRSFELLYRLGGEEFLLVLPGAEAPQAREIADRLCETLRTCRPGDLHVTVSIGVATASGAGVAFESLFKAADQALYTAKARGRDRVVGPVAIDASAQEFSVDSAVPDLTPTVTAPSEQ